MTDAQFSVVQYRPDPSRPTVGAILLGVIVEVETQETWAVCLQARGFLSEKELQRLDGIGRDIFARPFEYLKREVESVLGAPDVEEGSALLMLAQQHEWSLFISKPQQVTVDFGPSLTETLERVTRELYQTHIVGARPPQRSRAATTSSVPPRPWAIPPSIWELRLTVPNRSESLFAP
jgi:hypothetical protein